MDQQIPPFFVNLLPIVAIVAIFYFTMIRPQQKQEAERKKMLAAIEKGNKVLTAGGIVGTVASVNGDDIEVKIAENVKTTFSRQYIIAVLKDNAATPLNPQS